ncbi:DUF5706 domain-containing protein [Sphingomonas sp. LB-2]|uniref:Pycsar system effector family protein n=1 Tax=Sphingomonas caeni TaxID=2984949 RepID=UPI002231E74F|nr:Pycsar system effector family protein [Sphingomonas caeni]MCW3848281.1 DUF5706 domain-containing protein [Sphingomonas caeni]
MAEPDPPKPLTQNFVHVVRTTQAIHLQLSQMADQKASILMGATFVIFTITIGQAHGAMPPLPLAILGSFAFFSAILAMLVVMPVLRPRKRPDEAPLNLLFFGSFTRLDEDEFIERLCDKLTTDRGALELMARDLYQNGQVLRRKKYRVLGLAYRVFLVGLVASFAAFLWGMIA